MSVGACSIRTWDCNEVLVDLFAQVVELRIVPVARDDVEFRVGELLEDGVCRVLNAHGGWRCGEDRSNVC